MAAARGEHKQARAALRDDLAQTAGHDDMALHLELAARAISVEADALDQARLNGRRADPVAARAAATQIMSSAAATTVRVVAAGGRLSPPLALLQAVAKAHLSRIPGPGNLELWAQIADDDLAGPYLVGIARYQEGAALLASRGSRHRATTALRAADTTARDLRAGPLHAEIAALARAARIDLAPAAVTPSPPADPTGVGLTPREREVLALLGNGLSNAHIANTYTSAKRLPASMSPTSCASSASPAASRRPPPPTSSSFEQGTAPAPGLPGLPFTRHLEAGPPAVPARAGLARRCARAS